MPNQPNLPKDSQRIAIVGSTGTGKTQAGLWHLSLREFDLMPWVIFNFKYDDKIDAIKHAHHVDLGFIPKRPGLYIVHPEPSQMEEVNEYLWKLWGRENVGIFADEGYMMPNPRKYNAFQAILTQGRSKRVPVICLSQRPLWMSRFVWSESDFFQIFRLTDDDDTNTVRRFVKDGSGEKSISNRLPKYHSYYYDVGDDAFFTFKPVPAEDEILESIDAKLRPLRGRI